MSKTRGIVFEAEVSRDVEPGVVTLYDMSRYGSNGAMTDVTWEQIASGLWVPQYNATTSLIAIPGGPHLSNIFAGGGTIRAWVNLASDGEINQGEILDNWNAGSANGGFFLITRDEAAGMLRLRFYTLWSGADGWWQSTTVSSVAINNWCHLVVTYNSDLTTNDPNIYVNLAPQALTEGGTPTGTISPANNDDLIIGNRFDASRTADGQIPLVRLWNYILTPGQLYTDFTAQRSLFGV